MLTTVQARGWLDRWDRQQEQYIADREDRFDVIADVVNAAVGRDDPVVLDLGCGPGSLSVCLADRLPGAQIVGVDADRLLLGLARSAYGDRRQLRFVDVDLRTDGWAEKAGLTDGVDAAVSTTALHWLDRGELGDLYRELGRIVRPGGIFVDGDHLHTGSAAIDELARVVREARADRVLPDRDGEQWDQWWAAVGDAPELAGLVDARGARPIDHRVDELPTLDDHLDLLRTAGFTTTGVVWQHGDDRVVVGIRD